MLHFTHHSRSHKAIGAGMSRCGVYSRPALFFWYTVPKPQPSNAMIEEVFVDAVTRYLGNDTWGVDDISGRVVVVEYDDGVQLVCLDECPILRLYPAESIDDETQRIPYEHLLPFERVVH